MGYKVLVKGKLILNLRDITQNWLQGWNICIKLLLAFECYFLIAIEISYQWYDRWVPDETPREENHRMEPPGQNPRATTPGR